MLPIKALRETLLVVAKHGGNAVKAAAELNLSPRTVRDRLIEAKRLKVQVDKNGVTVEDLTVSHLQRRVKVLETEVRSAREATLTADFIKREIIQLNKEVAKVRTPQWMIREGSTKSGVAFGVPTLLVSDLHAGEVVDPLQVNGVNAYDLKVFDRRMETLASSTVRLLNILSPKMDFPGIVLDFAGDNVSGNIHDELAMTNELNTMPTVLYLFETLGGFIKTMAETFKRVHIEWTTGNHGRDTKKIWNKDRHHTSFDWLLGCFLARHFSGDERITFHIPDAPDAYYKIYDYRYCLTHGDQFRSFGDSMIGSLGPIIRGDIKKRSRNSQIDLEYDTLVMGHWHQYIHLNRLIVNGSVKGYDEYAYSMNFPFEKPCQALWLTHPKYGITYRMPVYVDRATKVSTNRWVSVAK